MSPKPVGRGRPPTYVVGAGADELAAPSNLAERLATGTQTKPEKERVD